MNDFKAFVMNSKQMPFEYRLTELKSQYVFSATAKSTEPVEDFMTAVSSAHNRDKAEGIQEFVDRLWESDFTHLDTLSEGDLRNLALTIKYKLQDITKGD